MQPYNRPLDLVVVLAGQATPTRWPIVGWEQSYVGHSGVNPVVVMGACGRPVEWRGTNATDALGRDAYAAVVGIYAPDVKPPRDLVRQAAAAAQTRADAAWLREEKMRDARAAAEQQRLARGAARKGTV